MSASNLLLWLLPFLSALSSRIGLIFVRRLLAEAKDGTLPPNVKPYAAEVIEMCEFLIPFLSGAKTMAAPEAPPAV